MRILVRIFRGRLAGLLGLCLGASVSFPAEAGESAPLAAAAEAMRKALSSSASWRMERTLPGSQKTLSSSGVVVCGVGGAGIEWRVLEPFESAVFMKKDAMVFEDEDGKREKDASDIPRYDDIRKATDAFVAGDTDAVSSVFDVSAESLPGGKWRVVLKPRPAALRELVESAEISGAGLPETAVLKSASGAESRITFIRREGDA